MIGKVIGDYRIEREIGEGGMSRVYLGVTTRQTEILPEGYKVVLKVLSEELSGEETAKKRFVKEAQILAKLRHRYITRFYEFLPTDTSTVLIMEYVEGHAVDQVIARDGALPIRQAVDICQSLLEALVYAHGKGIIHRDIKPANLLLQQDGKLKVTDFGIAKIKEGAGTGQTVLTKSGFLLGTPHYMSPEQIREPKDAGAQSDVYSTAVVLYEMLTGQLPFNSRSLPKLIDAVYHGKKTPPREARAEIDVELEKIVLKGMQPRMAERYQTARDFYEALEEWSARPALVSTIPLKVDEQDSTSVRADATSTQGAPAEEPAGSWHLVSVRDNGKEHFEIAGENVVVGRDRSCAIVLTHPAVSRRHAKITASGSTFVLEDLQSANGTFVNNSRVEKVDLKPGDIVRFGADPACSFVLKTIAPGNA